MIRVPLTRNKSTIIDDIDSDLIDGRNWLCSINHKNGNHYAYRRDLGGRKDPRTLRYLHRIIIERTIGRNIKRCECVDHKNGDSLDNRRSNLRIASRSQNQSNIKRIRAKTGFKGVVKYRNIFAVFCAIQKSKFNRYIGSFDTAEAAAKAYDNEAIRRAGIFAATNQELNHDRTI